MTKLEPPQVGAACEAFGLIIWSPQSAAFVSIVERRVVARQNCDLPRFQQFPQSRSNRLSAIKAAMFRVLGLLFGLLHRSFHSQRDLLLENLALRQQLLAFQRRNPKPRLRSLDRLFWVMARRLWSKWKQALMYVTPETVACWHRAGFRLYWSWLSRHRKTLGRKRINKQVGRLSRTEDRLPGDGRWMPDGF
jgi:hypothetical protein